MSRRFLDGFRQPKKGLWKLEWMNFRSPVPDAPRFTVPWQAIGAAVLFVVLGYVLPFDWAALYFLPMFGLLDISVGTAPNDGTGTNRRTAWLRVKDWADGIDSLQSQMISAGDKRFATQPTIEAKISAARVQAAAELKTIVVIPLVMTVFNAALVDFTNTNIRNVVEGGDYSVYDAWAYGALGPSPAIAIQVALTAAPAGQIVYCPPTLTGYDLGNNSLTVPTGVTLRGGNVGFHGGRWVDGVGLTAATVPGGSMLKITSTTHSPIKLGHNSTVQGFTFWYPNQTWNITSLAQNFVAYPATVLLGLTTGAINNPQVLDCLFLGATIGIEQFDSAGGVSLNALHVENCCGAVLGPFLKIYETADPIRIRNVTLNSHYVVSYVSDATVGGNAQVFRTKMAQVAKIGEFGKVADPDFANIYGYGLRYFVHYKKNMFAGDANQEAGGRYVNCFADAVQAMFLVERSSTTTPIELTNCTCAPIGRPNGVVGDNAEQGLVVFDTGVSQVRMIVHAVRVHGTAQANFVTNYTGSPAYAFRARGALGAGVSIMGNGLFFDNMTSGIADTNTSGILTLGIHANADVMQDWTHPKGVTLGGDLNAVGGYRHTIDGWYQDNVTANQTAIALNRGNAGAPLSWVSTRAGSLTGLFVKSNEARTAGTLTIALRKNGSPWGPTVVLNASATTFDYTHPAKDVYDFTIGDVISLVVTTDAGWLPVTADITAGIEVET